MNLTAITQETERGASPLGEAEIDCSGPPEAPLGGEHRPNARVIPAGPSGFGDSCGSAKPTPGALRGGVFVSNARPELELSHRVLKPRNNRRRQVYPLIMFKWRASRPRHVLPVGESSI